MKIFLHQMKKLPRSQKKLIYTVCKSCFWFATGIVLGLFFLISFGFIIFQRVHVNKIYPGVSVAGIPFGGKTQEGVENYFSKKNAKAGDTQFIFSYGERQIKVSARELNFGYNASLLAKQAYSIGRSKDIVSNISLISQAYVNGIDLAPSYNYFEDLLEKRIDPLIKKAAIESSDALFTFQNGRVIAFRPSSEGQEVDLQKLHKDVSTKTFSIILSQKPKTIFISLPIKIVKPKITTDNVNDLGIKELIGTGTSLFQGSIQNRVHNVTLAATRMNGILIVPNEIFSFNNALGDISAFTGYKQAYVIQNGKTVLGDGGGVCQVSTTLFRAVLNAGLPIVERNAHAYRVHYYEEDSPPGIDATVYGPTVDFRFKNDTENYILIQTTIDPSYERLTFYLYGTKDGREVTLVKPIITSQTPAPEPLYQDGPTLPKGVVKQIDFKASGANIYFTREVRKDGKVILSDKFTSNYRPWQAVFLRGTQE